MCGAVSVLSSIVKGLISTSSFRIYSHLSGSVAADFGGGGEAQGDFSSTCLSFYAQCDGGPLSSSRTHSHRQELSPWHWE